MRNESQLDEIQVCLNFLSARLKGKKTVINIKNHSKKNVQIMVQKKYLVYP